MREHDYKLDDFSRAQHLVLVWVLLSSDVEAFLSEARTWMDTKFLSRCFGFDFLRHGRCRGSATDVSNCQKGKPRHDTRKRLPEEVRRSDHCRGSRRLRAGLEAECTSYITGRIPTSNSGALRR